MAITKKISSGWAKIKFLYHYASAMTLTADYALSGYPIANILNRLEIDYWQSSSANDQNITDTGSAGSEQTVDYLVLFGHNLATIGAEVTLQYSNDNFSADINDAFTAETPSSDEIFFKEFDQVAEDYWRLNITGCSAAPKITIGYWGQITELGHCTVSFDPNERIIKDTTSISRTGYLLGTFEEYMERKQKFTWRDFEPDDYVKLETCIETVRKENFFTVWDSANHATEVFLMRSADGRIYAPYSMNGRYRNASVNLIGRYYE